MIKRLAAFLLIFNCAVSYAQTIKTDVLVIGGSPSGVAAAIQCARSKVKTVLVEPSSRLCPELMGQDILRITIVCDLPGGIWGEFRKRVKEHYSKTTGFDTAFNAPLKFEPDTGAAILARIADTVKNLTINLNTTFSGIEKDGDRWEVTIMQDGKKETIKPRVVIDATANGDILKKANAVSPAGWAVDINDKGTLYRTSIASGNIIYVSRNATTVRDGIMLSNNTCFVPMCAIVAKGADNLLVSETHSEIDKDIENLPMQLSVGQGVGVTAAYCAFFKTATANLNVRAIQGELQDFKGYLQPLEDITQDPYWRAMQQICTTGLLKGKYSIGKGYLFMPDSIVTTAEIKPVMLEIYTRAFIWFNREKPGTQFTIGNLLSFISELTLTDPDNLRKSISKAWTEQFHFTSPFDPDRPINRREFAILANKYLNPFARTVDLSGRVVN